MMKFVRWFFGLGFVIMSLGYLAEGSKAIIPGILLASLLIPPIDRLIASKIANEKVHKYYTSKGVKVILALVLFGFFTAATPDQKQSNEQVAKSENSQPTSAQQETKTEEVKPTAIFDIPRLLTMNLDDLKKELGTSETNMEPTNQQKELISEWDLEYKKNDRLLVVTYNTRTNVIDNLWLEGSDKDELLRAGNLEKKSDQYVTKYTYEAGDNKKVTGVTVAKKQPSEADADIKYNLSGLRITNKEDLDWKACKVTLNSDYRHQDLGTVEAKGTEEVSFASIVKKDGTRFNVISTSPQSVCLSCETSVSQSRISCYSF